MRKDQIISLLRVAVNGLVEIIPGHEAKLVKGSYLSNMLLAWTCVINSSLSPQQHVVEMQLLTSVPS